MRPRIPLVLSVAVLFGLAAGIGVYTFVYARGYAYLTDNASACANCHVMTEQYDGWVKSAHGKVAVCNDCHTPAGFVPKYLTKMENGFRHSFAFTTGLFPEPIRITEHDREVANLACRKCHAAITDAIDGPHGPGGSEGELSCLGCHRRVGHL